MVNHPLQTDNSRQMLVSVATDTRRETNGTIPQCGWTSLVRIAGLGLVIFALVVVSGSAAQQEKPTELIQFDFAQFMQVGFKAWNPAAKKMQRLTYSPLGITNLTVLKIDGEEAVFGYGPPDAEPTGLWLEKKALVIRKQDKTKEGSATWSYKKIHVVQTVHVVKSHTGKYDTCAVRYDVSNQDTKAHAVGIRVLLDTCIADNDGNAFVLVGGGVGEEIIVTKREFVGDKIPSVIKAVEKPNLANPGFFAYLTPKVKGLKAPTRLFVAKLLSDPARWEEKAQNMANDSAALIYWDPRELNPGAPVFSAGYAYGLGKLID